MDLILDLTQIKKSIRLYLNDYDGNEQLDPVLTFKRENGKFYPYDLRHNLIDQMKPLRKFFQIINLFAQLVLMICSVLHRLKKVLN